MRVIISAGGTGGHIYPALAIIDKIKEKEPDSEFLYIGTHNRMEKDIVPSKGISYEAIEMYGFNKMNLLKNFKTIDKLFKGIKKCKRIIKDFNPDIVIGVGGYITVPVLVAAQKLGYKTFIHEQNSIPGKSNMYLSKKASLIGVSFKSSKEYFKTDNVIFTGNPCGENALKVEPANKEEFGLSNDKKLVLFVMGSLGSSKMNDFLVQTMHYLDNKNYEILFVTGKSSYEEVSKNVFPNNVKVVPYVENMTRIMKRTDLIVSRAGASTLSEIISLKMPSILIPSPYVANNHQYKNALDLYNHRACELLEEKELSKDILVKKIDLLINDDMKLNEIKNNLSTLDAPNSATIIYDSLVKLIDRN